MESAEMVSQGKASKTQKTQSHEFCHGYVDANGIWNNGFYCRRWGRPDDKYCCEELEVRFCCPEPISPPQSRTSSTFEPVQATPSDQPPLPAVDGPDGSSIMLPIIIGSGVGVALITCCLLIVCLVCRCCGGRRRSSKPIPGNKRLSFSVEAEATSAVIAAQALQKEELQHHQHHHHHQQQQQQQQKQQLLQQQQQHQQLLGHHTCMGEDGPLHCGCRWSPSTSRSTVVDLDSLIATMQQNITNSWQQQEMETTLGHPCDQQGRPYNPLMNPQSKRIFNGSSDRPLNGNVSPSISMEPFRPPSLNSASRQQHPQHYFPLDDNVKMMGMGSEQGTLTSGDRSLRGYAYSPHSQMNELRQMKCSAFADCSDRQKRDSGVLVEEPDVVQDTNPSPSLSTINATTTTTITGGIINNNNSTNIPSSFLPVGKFSSPSPQLLVLGQR